MGDASGSRAMCHTLCTGGVYQFVWDGALSLLLNFEHKCGNTVTVCVPGMHRWAFGVWGWCERMSLISNLTFGAIISATDPVSLDGSYIIFESSSLTRREQVQWEIVC